MEGLTAEQVSFFNSEGYLVLENFASEEECNILIKKMAELVEEFDPSTISIFSTKNPRQLTDDYFYESANKISFFFEEKAFTDDGNLKQSKSLSINKVGHALHDLEPNFHKFSYSPRFSAVLSSLGYNRPVLMQSMYIFKQPGIGGEVVPHQDNSFLYTDPTSCIGMWVALEAANIENGCLWVLPASHKGGLRRRLFRDGIGGVTFDKPSPDYDLSKFVPVEVKTGTLVVIHGDLVHQSFENKSSKSRHAYSFHAVETDSCNWASDNWLVKKTPPVPLYTK